MSLIALVIMIGSLSFILSTYIFHIVTHYTAIHYSLLYNTSMMNPTIVALALPGIEPLNLLVLMILFGGCRNRGWWGMMYVKGCVMMRQHKMVTLTVVVNVVVCKCNEEYDTEMSILLLCVLCVIYHLLR